MWLSRTLLHPIMSELADANVKSESEPSCRCCHPSDPTQPKGGTWTQHRGQIVLRIFGTWQPWTWASTWRRLACGRRACGFTGLGGWGTGAAHADTHRKCWCRARLPPYTPRGSRSQARSHVGGKRVQSRPLKPASAVIVAEGLQLEANRRRLEEVGGYRTAVPPHRS